MSYNIYQVISVIRKPCNGYFSMFSPYLLFIKIIVIRKKKKTGSIVDIFFLT